MIIQMMEKEYWYGGCVSQGSHMPVGAEDHIHFKFDHNPTPNQAMPLFLSSKGRYMERNRIYN